MGWVLGAVWWSFWASLTVVVCWVLWLPVGVFWWGVGFAGFVGFSGLLLFGVCMGFAGFSSFGCNLGLCGWGGSGAYVGC